MLLEQQQQQQQEHPGLASPRPPLDLSLRSEADPEDEDEARNAFVFSTPVRASFRRRPKTMIMLEEAKTPSKIDSRYKRST